MVDKDAPTTLNMRWEMSTRTHNMKIDEEIKHSGIEHKVPISLDDTLSFVCNKINETKAKQILEIGTAIGYSAITMAENTTCAHIDTLEIDEDRFIIAEKNVLEHKLNKKISLYLVDAMDYLKTTNKTYDFIYLDGPKGQYINYLPYLVKILKRGGVLVADNLYFHGMVTGKIPTSKGCRAMIKGLKNYIATITNHPALTTQILDIGDGLGYSIKK